MNVFVKNIRQLVTVAAHGRNALTGAAMRDPGIIPGAGVLCRGGRIAWVGPMSAWKDALPEDVPELDAAGMTVLPGFVDSHTHAMFAGDRVDEFAMRSAGHTYQEIAEAGGGIAATVRSVRAASKKELKRLTIRRLNDMMRHGTTTVEMKSGYGLTEGDEVKMLEAINELKDEEIIGVVPTFLGAHAIPAEFREHPEAYVDLLVDRMIPYAGRKQLAEFCDVFCERGYFDLRQGQRILEAGKVAGLRPKVHADELTPMGGAELAARVGAVSADHLEHAAGSAVTSLREAGVVATLLPGVSFFLHHGYAPARALIDGGVPVAIATDFNPGSCMSFSMPMMMSIACTQMGMTPEEALTAATLNGAAALGRSANVGSIEPGKDADLLIADVPDYRYLAYHFGVNPIRTIIKHGTILEF